MNTGEYVLNLITNLKNQGVPLSTVAWEAALSCVGWPYVFGARGQDCTPANRRARYREDHPTIKTSCKNFDGEGSCSGCKWYPGGKRVKMFDCRGFTYWVLKMVYDGWELDGTGCTKQWNNEDNWTAKGTIETMPKDTLCCLFVQKGKTMEHTGFGLNDETVECSVGVQYFKTRNKKWTHWAVPKVVSGSVTPEPAPAPTYRTLKRGDKGADVKFLQEKLVSLGYDIGAAGIDGDYGRATQAAVSRFQKDWGLKEDGICGPQTWSMILSASPRESRYTVTIPSLTYDQAKNLCDSYPGSSMKEV